MSAARGRTRAASACALAAAMLAGCAGAPAPSAPSPGGQVEAAAQCVGRGTAQAVLSSVDGAGERDAKARALGNC